MFLNDRKSIPLLAVIIDYAFWRTLLVKIRILGSLTQKKFIPCYGDINEELLANLKLTQVAVKVKWLSDTIVFNI